MTASLDFQSPAIRTLGSSAQAELLTESTIPGKANIYWRLTKSEKLGYIR